MNRAARLDPNGSYLVRRLRRVIEGANGQTRILAASIKSPAEVVTAVTDGAHAVTAPLAVIRDLYHHPLTESAIEAFTADGSRSVGEIPDQSLTGR